MRRKWSWLVFIGALLCAVGTVTACNGSSGDTEIRYELMADGDSYAVARVGRDLKGSVEIPDSYENKAVLRIKEGAFQKCSRITHVVLPDAVTAIERDTFEGCTALTSVKFPAQLEDIGKRAFANCTGFTQFQIPKTVTSLSEYAFEGCTNLRELTVEEGSENFCASDNVVYDKPVTKIVTVASDSIVQSITLLSGITEIADRQFIGCEYFTHITIPEGVKSIGEEAFSTSWRIDTISLPQSLEKIGNAAFKGCKRLEKLVIPNNVTEIGQSAFEGCEFLDKLTLSSKLKEIGERAFWGCLAEKIILPTSLEYIGDAVFYGETTWTKKFYYEGSEESWGQIIINGYLTREDDSPLLYYFSDTYPTKPGLYWHYNENHEIITIW